MNSCMEYGDDRLPKRFWDKVRVTDSGCWEWTAYVTNNGYGQFCVEGKMQRPHRLTYSVFFGQIPTGLQCDHLCRNRACCNPSHIEPVTGAENIRRGRTGEYMRSRTHCNHGHLLSGWNVIWHFDPPMGRRYRRCRECKRVQDAKRSSVRRVG